MTVRDEQNACQSAIRASAPYNPPTRHRVSLALVQALALASLAFPAAAEAATHQPENGMLLVGTFSVLAAILTGLIAAISLQAATQRRIQMDNVVGQRAKWRAQIRRLASDVHKAMIMENRRTARRRLLELKAEFRTVLNPYDPDDAEIVKAIDVACMRAYVTTKTKVCEADKFVELISSLLKHDWERAKEEVRHPILRSFKEQKPVRGKASPEVIWKIPSLLVGIVLLTCVFALFAPIAPLVFSCYLGYWEFVQQFFGQWLPP